MNLLFLLSTALARDPIVRVAGEEVPDPHRWLEDTHDPAVQAWWAERDAEARAWTAQGGLEEALARFADDWEIQGAPRRSLLDAAGGVQLVRAWEPAPQAEGEPDDASGAEESRGRVRLLVADAGGERELVAEGVGSDQAVCAWSLDPGGRYVAWGRLAGGCPAALSSCASIPG